MRIVVVGEAWGRYESEFKHALVGPSGRELTLEMGISKLAPFMTLICRRCKQTTEFAGNHCQHCKANIWPNEFDLIEHWKNLRSDYGIAVTNVFNKQPAPLYKFDDIGWSLCEVLSSFGRNLKLRRLVDNTEHTVDARGLVTNDLAEFFGTQQETEMPAWKASKITPGSHLRREHLHHLMRLWDEILTLNPNLILCLGNAACWAILGQTKITALRGTVAWSERLQKKTLPTFHPAAVLRQLPMRVSVISDLAKAAREAKFPELRRPERWIRILDPTENGIAEGYRWLKQSATNYTVDIETLRRQISIIGFGSSPGNAMVIPFRDANIDNAGHLVEVGKIAKSMGFAGGVNYWPTEELEFKAWKLAIEALATPQAKIFQNGLFDLSHITRMGIVTRNVAEDTMLWHHAMYAELPKSLGYMASLYANEVAWKLMRRHESLKRDE